MLPMVILSDEFQMYKNDFDLNKQHTQLKMLPDLIRIRNTNSSGAPIMQVTNVRREQYLIFLVNSHK